MARDPRRPRLADRDRARPRRPALPRPRRPASRRQPRAARRPRRATADCATPRRRLIPLQQRSANASPRRRLPFSFSYLAKRTVEDRFEVADVALDSDQLDRREVALLVIVDEQIN